MTYHTEGGAARGHLPRPVELGAPRRRPAASGWPGNHVGTFGWLGAHCCWPPARIPAYDCTRRRTAGEEGEGGRLLLSGAMDSRTSAHGTGRISFGRPWLAFGYLVSGVRLYGCRVVAGPVAGTSFSWSEILVGIPRMLMTWWRFRAPAAKNSPATRLSTNQPRRRSANDTGDTVSLIGHPSSGPSLHATRPRRLRPPPIGPERTLSSSASSVPRRDTSDDPGRPRAESSSRLPVPRLPQGAMVPGKLQFAARSVRLRAQLHGPRRSSAAGLPALVPTS